MIRPVPVLMVGATVFLLTIGIWWCTGLEEADDDSSSQEETDDDSYQDTQSEQVSGVWRMRAAATTPDAEVVEEVEVAIPALVVETVVEVMPEPVFESTPESEPALEPASEPTSESTPEPTPEPEPTSCTFVNGNRPKVGEKFILKCREGEFIAVAQYLGQGRFEFSDFEPHAP